MSTAFEHLKLNLDEDGVALLALNRPGKLNALSIAMMEELHSFFDTLSPDGPARGVILTGSGEKAFAAGADISEFGQLDGGNGIERARRGQALCMSIETAPVPVVAAVNGFALGGGAELALACHLRVASPDARFGFPETGLGLIPGFGGTQRLTRLTGAARALDLILTGRRIDADEALAMGIFNRVAGEGVLIDEARLLLESILANAPLAVRAAIRAVGEAGGPDGYRREAELFGSLCGTDDFREGREAFLGKRKAQFRGR